MKERGPERLPAAPLLHAYVSAGVPGLAELGRLPGLGRRCKAVLGATATLLDGFYLDRAPEPDFLAALTHFYQSCVEPPLHLDRLGRRAGIIRHGIGHLLRCPDPLPVRLARCVRPDGAYFVAGLGPSFWSALVQGLRPDLYPAWTPATVAGLQRLGMLDNPAADAESVYAGLLTAFDRLRDLAPGLTALHGEHFLSLVSRMHGRHLFAGADRLGGGPAGVEVAAAVRAVRAARPLRGRLKDRGEALARAQEQLEEGLRVRDGKLLGRALAVADPEGCGRAPLDWGIHGEELTLWIGRLWEADDPHPILASFWAEDKLPGAGLWLPAAVLHLKDPQSFQPWNDPVRAGYALLDDCVTGPPAQRYELFNEGAAWLREKHHLHPLETADVLKALAEATDGGDSDADRFGGFCPDTFRFLRDLGENNSREWMEGQRQRCQFVLRGPLTELCRTLAGRYVEPVLRGRHGLDLHTDPRSGRALTSLCKNDFGRTTPYQTTHWITFCGRDDDGNREGLQFFVRLDAHGLHSGLRLGARGRGQRTALRERLVARGPALYQLLAERAAFEDCRLHSTTAPPEGLAPASAEEFCHWLTERELEVSHFLPPQSPLLAGEDLVGTVLLTFDRLLPLYTCAAGLESPEPLAPGRRFREEDFRRATFLDDTWLRRALGLLRLKRQMILQGVPGTGKTHVARCLARLLAGDDPDAVRLVQFHPAYSYEEFVEGIRARSVDCDGRHGVTYPVEDGLLCEFAARAAAQPSRPHVLLIDEINRGNLPRIFGELLYLLEYREQEVSLPYSRRRFRLPGNLYLLGTMNAADRSTAPVDQALRRRFSFLEMPPDADVLRAWLEGHPSVEGGHFAGRVVALFERLNARLRSEFGPGCQVGHSYFMLDDLDEGRLRVVWEHQVRPLLDEFLLLHPGRSVSRDLDDWLDGDARPSRRRPAATPTV